MNATVLDDRRRLVMPPELPAKSSVIVEQVDDDTWVVRRARPSRAKMVMLLPDVKHLPGDPEWEKIEARLARHAIKNLTPPDEDL